MSQEAPAASPSLEVQATSAPALLPQAQGLVDGWHGGVHRVHLQVGGLAFLSPGRNNSGLASGRCCLECCSHIRVHTRARARARACERQPAGAHGTHPNVANTRAHEHHPLPRCAPARWTSLAS